MKTNYLFQVIRHKWFVLLAGIRIGGFPIWRLLIHDWSKFLPSEYSVYKKRFTSKEYTEEEWEKAWLHHIHFNPHHHEHWMIKGQAIRMPDVFVKEMVIDWHGAGRGYQGSWDIQPWIDANYQKIVLHPESLEKLKSALKSRGLKWPTD